MVNLPSLISLWFFWGGYYYDIWACCWPFVCTALRSVFCLVVKMKEVILKWILLSAQQRKQCGGKNSFHLILGCRNCQNTVGNGQRSCATKSLEEDPSGVESYCWTAAAIGAESPGSAFGGNDTKDCLCSVVGSFTQHFSQLISPCSLPCQSSAMGKIAVIP